MALEHDKQFQMRVSEDFLRRLDDWRRGQPGLPTRAEAVRKLIEAGIKAIPSMFPEHISNPDKKKSP
jgi:hypothetical protein